MKHLIGIFSMAECSAEELLWNRQPWATWRHYRGIPIGPMELADLAALLGVDSYDRSIAGFSLLAGESQDMPWLISIPPDVVEAIGSLNHHDMLAAANLWAQRGDMARRFSEVDLVQYLTGTGEFLRSTPGPYALLVTAPEDKSVAHSE